VPDGAVDKMKVSNDRVLYRVVQTCTAYFATTHPWFPSISKERMPQATSDDHVAPFVLDGVYAATTALQCLHRTSGDEVLGAASEDAKRIVRRLGRRWRLGQEYLALLHQHGITNTNDNNMVTSRPHVQGHTKD
jgi:hypothetical protein